MILDTEKIELLRNNIKNAFELNNVDIPDDIKISTMTLEAKMTTKFNPWNIFKYIRRSADGIVSVVSENRNKKEKQQKKAAAAKAIAVQIGEDYRDIARANIALSKKKQTISKNKQSEKFLNQVTVNIKVSSKVKPISVKVFNNGTVHFTGCVCVDNLLEAMYKLCLECRREVGIMTPEGKIVDIEFAEDINKLCVENMYDFKVDMINCIFTVPFSIDRPKLQVLLKADGYKSFYDSNNHPGVKIKYASSDKKVTIFTFETGSIIIILGKQGFNRINEIYCFIYRYLLENYESIVKNDDITTSSILKYIEIDNKKITIDEKIVEKPTEMKEGKNKKKHNNCVANRISC
jgi:hypothetical protein